MCLVWPDNKPDEHIFEVKIDDDDTIAALKKSIKEEYARRLRYVFAPDLVLWKCSIPDDPNLKETLNAIHFDGTDPSVERLVPLTLPLSEHFATGLPRKTIHILVEVPTLGECGTYISYSMTEARMFLAENEVPPVSLAALLRERQRFSAELPTTAPSTLGFPSEISNSRRSKSRKSCGATPCCRCHNSRHLTTPHLSSVHRQLQEPPADSGGQQARSGIDGSDV